MATSQGSGLPVIGFVVGMVIAATTLAFVFSLNLEAAEVRTVEALEAKYGTDLSIAEYRTLLDGDKVIIDVDGDEVQVSMTRDNGKLVLIDGQERKLPERD